MIYTNIYIYTPTILYKLTELTILLVIAAPVNCLHLEALERDVQLGARHFFDA